MTKPLTLAQFVDQSEECEDGVLSLRFKGTMPPKVLENLRRLRRLDLLTDDVVLSLLGQAPIDPLGLFGALRLNGAWAFQPLDCTMVQVLAKKGSKLVALMRVDLLSDDVTFVALKAGQLVEHVQISGEQLYNKLREEGMTETRMLGWFQGYINETVAAGLSAAGLSVQ